MAGVSGKWSRGRGTKKPVEPASGIFTSFFDGQIFSSARAVEEFSDRPLLDNVVTVDDSVG